MLAPIIALVGCVAGSAGEVPNLGADLSCFLQDGESPGAVQQIRWRHWHHHHFRHYDRYLWSERTPVDDLNARADYGPSRAWVDPPAPQN